MKRIRSEASSVTTNENEGGDGDGDGDDTKGATRRRLGAESRRLAAAARKQKVRDERERRREAAASYRRQKADINNYFRERHVWHAFRLAREGATFWYGEMCAKFRALAAAAAAAATRESADAVCSSRSDNGSSSSGDGSSSGRNADEVEIARLYLSDPGPESFDRLFDQWRFVAESDMRRVLLVPRLGIRRRSDAYISCDDDDAVVSGPPVVDGAFSLPLSVWTVEVAGHLSLREFVTLACTCRRLQHAHRVRLDQAARSVLPRLTRICEWHPDPPTRTARATTVVGDIRATTTVGDIRATTTVAGNDVDVVDVKTASVQRPAVETEKQPTSQAVRRRHVCHPSIRTPAIRARLEAEYAAQTARHTECRCTNYYMLPYVCANAGIKRWLPSTFARANEVPLPRFVLVGTSELNLPTGYLDKKTVDICRCHSHGDAGHAANSVLARYQSAECYRAGTFACLAIRLLASTTRKAHDPVQTLVRVLVYCRRLQALVKAAAVPECERDLDAWLHSVGLDACLA